MDSSNKYTIEGQEVEVVQALERGFLVRSVYENPEGESYVSGSPWVAAAVFDSPPTEKLDKRIVQLQETIRELEEKRRKLHKDTAKVEADSRALFKKCERYEALRLLEQFLDGKITHYVNICSYSNPPEIIPIGDTKCQYSRGELKLLTLFGDSKGSLNWKLNRYSDGSGCYSDVIPCTSLEEAQETVRNWILNEAAATQDEPRERVIQSANKYNITLPDGYREKYLERRIIAAQANIDSSKKELQQRENEMNALLAERSKQ